MFKYKLSNRGREFFGLLLSILITTGIFVVFSDKFYLYYVINLLFDVVLIGMFWEALEDGSRSLLRYIIIFSFSLWILAFYLLLVLIFDFGPTLFERRN